VTIPPDADLHLHKPKVEGNQLHAVPIHAASFEGMFSSSYVSNITVLHTALHTEDENFGHSVSLSSELFQVFNCVSVCYILLFMMMIMMMMMKEFVFFFF
jgi:hypothetical protein